MESLSDKIIEVECNGTDLTDGLLIEDVKEFIREVLKEMDNLNQKFEAIAMRCNIETMAGDKLILPAQTCRALAPESDEDISMYAEDKE